MRLRLGEAMSGYTLLGRKNDADAGFRHADEHEERGRCG